MSDLTADLAAVHTFWFEEVGPDGWWTRSAETDAAIIERFEGVWKALRDRPANDFLCSSADAVAAVVLFDQFPRNMFRGEADAFATDALALAIVGSAVDHGQDGTLSEGERSFLYLPFMHAEDLAAQDRSVRLFEALGWPDPLKFARLHRDMIARYGRFPARNAALGRPDRPGEEQGIAESQDW